MIIGELELERIGRENSFKEGCCKEDQRNRVVPGSKCKNIKNVCVCV